MTNQDFINFTRSRIIILDGGTGSNLHQRGMPVGACPEKWMLDNPEIIIGLQEEFLESGTDILFAPTFTSNRIKLAEYGLERELAAYNRGLIGVSREAVRRYSSKTESGRDILIAADITMTGQQVWPVGRLSFEELVEVYKEQMAVILKEGVDLFVIETMMSLQECRAALLAARELSDIPVIVSLTYAGNGRTLYGTDPGTAVTVLQAMGAAAVGVNCSTGPEGMHSIIREMKAHAHVPIMAKPNAGMPKLIDGHTVFPMAPEEFAEETAKLVSEGATLVGGCCGSTPVHIRLLADKTRALKPVPVRTGHNRVLTTERRTVEIKLDSSLLIIGERINPTGKKALQEELKSGKLAIVSRMAQEQEELGAAILDINIGMPGIDEKEMMLKVVEEVLKVTSLPICIDSSNPDVIEAVLRIYPGRALINSISLEKEKCESLLPIAKKYGAMFILLPLSDKGMPKSIEEKKFIIHTIIDRAAELGLTGEDIIVDGLVNTVGANRYAAVEAIDTIHYCREVLGLATVVGLSNISFGLPERQYINSTFLSLAVCAGLTMAIANPTQELFMNTAYAADLLMGREGAADRYIRNVAVADCHTRNTATTDCRIGDAAGSEAVKGMSSKSDLTDKGKGFNKVIAPDTGSDVYTLISSGIYNAVLRGNKADIISLIDEELERSTKPGDILEKLLIPAIDEVGRLFDEQIYFLPQLIAGAQVMKQAVEYLEPRLSMNGVRQSKGIIVIATVKGDIHDIGKNLVTMMLNNYGYKVIDLGKDVAADVIINTARAEDADIIALSALMTTTMVEMKKVIAMARENRLKAKIIIGGAVITESYAGEIGADGYSCDAQSAVSLVNRLMNN